jgi:hypothetical protein
VSVVEGTACVPAVNVYVFVPFAGTVAWKSTSTQRIELSGQREVTLNCAGRTVVPSRRRSCVSSVIVPFANGTPLVTGSSARATPSVSCTVSGTFTTGVTPPPVLPPPLFPPPPVEPPPEPSDEPTGWSVPS